MLNYFQHQLSIAFRRQEWLNIETVTALLLSQVCFFSQLYCLIGASIHFLNLIAMKIRAACSLKLRKNYTTRSTNPENHNFNTKHLFGLEVVCTRIIFLRFQKFALPPEKFSVIKRGMSRVSPRHRTSPGPRCLRFTTVISVMGIVTSEDDHTWVRSNY